MIQFVLMFRNYIIMDVSLFDKAVPKEEEPEPKRVGFATD